MIFAPGLQPAVLIKRYKRFLADIRDPSGAQSTIHCPNTGAMTRCQGEGWRVWFTDSANPKRKYPCTWQVVENEVGELIGINSGLANTLAREAIENGTIAELAGYQSLRSEVAYGEQGSRVDFLLATPSPSNPREEAQCYVEVKSLTLGLEGGLGVFPDAVTTRGQKHLQELMWVREQGARAVLLFCVQHTGVTRVDVARHIDPDYARLLDLALSKGVELLAYSAAIDPEESEIRLVEALPSLV